jgi:hypothetical protein
MQGVAYFGANWKFESIPLQQRVSKASASLITPRVLDGVEV